MIININLEKSWELKKKKKLIIFPNIDGRITKDNWGYKKYYCFFSMKNNYWSRFSFLYSHINIHSKYVLNKPKNYKKWNYSKNNHEAHYIWESIKKIMDSDLIDRWQHFGCWKRLLCRGWKLRCLWFNASMHIMCSGLLPRLNDKIVCDLLRFDQLQTMHRRFHLCWVQTRIFSKWSLMRSVHGSLHKLYIHNKHLHLLL